MIYNPGYIRIAQSTSAYKALLAEFRQGRENHAYLLASPDTLLSLSIVAGVVIDGREEKQARRILSEKCADFKTYGKLTKDEAQEICDGCLYASSELDKKYFVINGSVNNESGQNKILKTLEEAPSGVIIFIVAPTESTLLPTIVSRCQLIQPRLEKEIDASDFDSLYADMAKYGAKNSLTVFDRLLFGAGASLFSSAVRVSVLLSERRTLEASELFPKNRDDFFELLGYMEIIFGDAMQMSYGKSIDTADVINLNKIASAFPKESYPNILAEIRRARRRTQSGNLTSVIDTLLVSIIGGE